MTHSRTTTRHPARHDDGRATRGRRHHRPAALAVLVAALLAAPLADAADTGGNFAAKGPGATSCQAFLDALKTGGEVGYAYGGWLEGYLTAVNQFLPETYDITAWETSPTLARLLANHCQNNLEISFLDATRQMVAALRDSRLVERSELVEATSGDQGTRMYKAAIERVQSRLAELGLYAGAVDGAYGESTRAAVRAFQEQKKLEPNGLPDQATLMHLMRAP